MGAHMKLLRYHMVEEILWESIHWHETTASQQQITWDDVIEGTGIVRKSLKAKSKISFVPSFL